jgi:nucleoside-diphosphate-sugar epimerase
MHANLKIAPNTRVLVTGATGFTGSVLLRKLINQGLNVVAIARSSSNLQPIEDLPIEWIRGDVFDEDIVKKAAKGTSYIFHLATPYREAKLPDSGFYQVHVLSTQLLAKAALEEPNFKRFVHVSTVGVHGHIEHPPADENYPINPGDIYQKTKVEAEQWLRNFAQQTGLAIAVVRPAAIYGSGDKRLLKIFQMVSQQWIPVIGKGNHLYHLIHVEDLADFLIHAAVHPQAIGEVFICGSKEAVSFQKMVGIISEYYQLPVKFIRLPAEPLFALSDVVEFVCKPLGIEPPIYRRRLAFFTKDRAFNTTKMRELAGFIPSYSDEEGLRKTAQWYLDRGWLNLKKVR